MTVDPVPMPWVGDAACDGWPLSVFFPDHGGPLSYDAAKAVCRGCTVREDCLAHALLMNEEAGCWGGLNPDERHALKATG